MIRFNLLARLGCFAVGVGLLAVATGADAFGAKLALAISGAVVIAVGARLPNREGSA